MSDHEGVSRQDAPLSSEAICPVVPDAPLMPDDSAEDIRTGDSMEGLLDHATEALSTAERQSTEEVPQEVSSGGLAAFPFPEFTDGTVDAENLTPEIRPAWEGENESEDQSEVNLQIELGRTRLEQSTIDSLRSGSVVPLDKQAGHSMDIYVDGQLIARGELLVLNSKFCIRVTERLAHGRHRPLG